MSSEPSPPVPPAHVAFRADILVIGAGQGGLSAAYHLRQLGLEGGRGVVVVDANAAPGGAWQHRWPSLTLETINRLHDLPGLGFLETIGSASGAVEAAVAVPLYYARYEAHFGLDVRRPVTVARVEPHGERLLATTSIGRFSVRGIISATGTWDHPYIPDYPGRLSFAGAQIHTRDYRSAEGFRGRRVAIIGGGISAIQLLDEISRVTETMWITRRPPQFREGPFGEEAGRQAVALVDARVRQGLPPLSVVSATGLPRSPLVQSLEARGLLNPLPIFSEITPRGFRWADGTEREADVIVWCTGFRPALDHLAPLGIFEPGGGIVMGGRLATRVEKEPRLHLIGYGPSASTIGANRAGSAAVRELFDHIGLTPRR